jgi:5-methylcytosine-specific restriction endonuclease McrA
MDPVKRKRTTVLKPEVPVLPKAKAKAKSKPKIKIVANPETVPKKKVVTEWVNKVHIPKKVRTDVWNTFIGPSIPIHKCLCCLKTTICMTDFQVGHVVSEHDGGNLNIDNLRPICASCNISMGTTNMKDYVLKYGYLI